MENKASTLELINLWAEKNESLLNLVQTVGVWLAAFGTLAAVIASLWIALSGRYSKVRLHLDISKIIQKGVPEKKAITISISNLGPYPIYLNYFGAFSWRVPGAKTAALQNPLTDYRHAEHLEVAAGKSASLLLADYDSFVEMVRTPNFFNLGRWKKRNLKNIYMSVLLSDGRRFKVLPSQSMKEKIREILKTS